MAETVGHAGAIIPCHVPPPTVPSVTRQQDEIDATLRPGPEDQPVDDTEQQDFALRNVAMSNALPGGAQPAAGAVIGSGGELGMDPETDEEQIHESDSIA